MPMETFTPLTRAIYSIWSALHRTFGIHKLYFRQTASHRKKGKGIANYEYGCEYGICTASASYSKSAKTCGGRITPAQQGAGCWPFPMWQTRGDVTAHISFQLSLPTGQKTAWTRGGGRPKQLGRRILFGLAWPLLDFDGSCRQKCVFRTSVP